ncbi:Scr1 family TA system antitoxin-like transcriptional regulator [Streptomyces sp. DW26H14]|uniref:Scr1 family TA system antitoxin-like transcriptional regulator n=1 Tax=Streptomyces sp. DW26H14 TaxID=3435395 RepID=UPI00403DD320
MNRKELDPEKSPLAAFGQRVRLLRDERGWTQDELAERMGCSGTHISAIETGRRPPTMRFAKSADRAFGTGDRLERQSQAVRQTALLEGFPEYVGYEGRAVEIRLYEIGIIPGLLQTPQYSRVLADSAVRRGAITPEQADERVAFLAERQAALVRPRPPMVMLVMDESCIRHTVGGAEVMEAQRRRLLEFAKLPNTVLQIAPFTMGELRPVDLPINLLTLPDRSMVAYAEAQTRGHLDREITVVVPILTAYHQLQAEALSQAASVSMIEQA